MDWTQPALQPPSRCRTLPLSLSPAVAPILSFSAPRAPLVPCVQTSDPSPAFPSSPRSSALQSSRRPGYRWPPAGLSSEVPVLSSGGGYPGQRPNPYAPRGTPCLPPRVSQTHYRLSDDVTQGNIEAGQGDTGKPRETSPGGAGRKSVGVGEAAEVWQRGSAGHADTRPRQGIAGRESARAWVLKWVLTPACVAWSPSNTSNSWVRDQGRLIVPSACVGSQPTPRPPPSPCRVTEQGRSGQAAGCPELRDPTSVIMDRKHVCLRCNEPLWCREPVQTSLTGQSATRAGESLLGRRADGVTSEDLTPDERQADGVRQSLSSCLRSETCDSPSCSLRQHIY